jgi:hypothetical protein
MIAAGSLSAFSTAVTPVGPAHRTPVPPVTPVRTTAAQSTAAQALAPQSSGGRQSPPASPGRILPRGSLLDLSV